jgi:hypothetical protein
VYHQIYQPEFISANASLFLTQEWIDNAYLLRVGYVSPIGTQPTLPVRVKLEPDASSTRHSTPEREFSSNSPPKFKTREWKEGDQDILEILSSDSEDLDFDGPRSASEGRHGAYD